MDGQLLELKNLKFIKNVSVFRPSSVYCTTMERMVLTAYIESLGVFKRKINDIL